jgi:signal transduction histidine kinase
LKAEDLDRIFERFYRKDSSRQREDGGSGLGLAIAKSIVQAHSGQVSAESEAGKGLKIIVSLPKN